MTDNQTLLQLAEETTPSEKNPRERIERFKIAVRAQMVRRGNELRQASIRYGLHDL